MDDNAKLQAERLQQIRKQLSEIEAELETMINRPERKQRASAKQKSIAKYLNKLG